MSHAIDLKLHPVYILPTCLENSYDTFPFFTGLEVFTDCAVFLRPSMLLGSVEESTVRLPDVGGITARAFVVVYYTGIAEQGNLVFI